MDIGLNILNLIDKHIGLVVFVIFFVTFRKSISTLFGRLTKLGIQYGEASGTLEAAPHPHPISLDPPGTTAAPIEEDQSREALEDKTNAASSEPRRWYPELWNHLTKGDATAAERTFNEHQRQQNDPDKRHDFEGAYLYLIFTYGKDLTAQRRLETLFESSGNDAQKLSSATWLSFTFTDTNASNEALHLWQRALTRVTDEQIKTKIVINIARTLAEIGEIQKGSITLQQRLRSASSADEKSDIYSAIAQLEKDAGNKEASAIAQEKSIEHAPGDQSLRFDAAYAQSEAGLDLLSLKNYEILNLASPDHSSAKNNLGVLLEQFNLNGLRTSHYRAAAELGETLAAANLANIYTNSGLFDEASALLEKARKADTPHENVGHAMVKLDKAKREEGERHKEFQDRAANFQTRARIYGSALFDITSEAFSFSGKWLTPDGQEIVVAESGRSISAIWEEQNPNVSYSVSIHGKRWNRAAVLQYKKDTIGGKNSGLLITQSLKVECFSYYDSVQSTWVLFSKESKSSFEIRLKRII